MITYKDIQKNKEINAMIEQGNQVLKTLGYTEHSKKHAIKVAEHAAEILKITGADAHQIELAQIAGYMHDIGNCINRQDHAHSGAILTYSTLIFEDSEIGLEAARRSGAAYIRVRL